MPLFGAHMSVAGGCRNAILAARAFGCQALQLFT
jgi:endonuclease IV